MRSQAAPLAVALLLAGCGGDDEPAAERSTAAATTPARAADCEMTAAAARRVHRLLARGGRRSSDAALVLRSEPSEADGEVLTRTDASPDRDRHVVVLVSAGREGPLEATATSGAHRLRLTAGPGCGAVDSVRDGGPYRVRFTLAGGPVDEIRPAP